MKIKIIIAKILLVTIPVIAQVESSDYTVTAEVGLGYSRYVTDLSFDKLNKNGFAGTARFMWNPDHLLSIGIETGYQYLYSINTDAIETEFGTSTFSASMIAVPIYIAYSMKVTDRIKLLAGNGIFLLYNSGDAFGDELSSSQISIAFNVGVSYAQPITNNFSIGGQLRYSYISKIQDQALVLQVLFVYELLRW